LRLELSRAGTLAIREADKSSYPLISHEIPAVILVDIVPDFLVLSAISVPINEGPVCMPSTPAMGVLSRIIVAHGGNCRARMLAEEALLFGWAARFKRTAAAEKDRK
jgi:hypothetical protein